MSAGHQIATDDERQDDLSSPVAESREAALFQRILDFLAIEIAADATCHEIADSSEDMQYYEGRIYAWKKSAEVIKRVMGDLAAGG